MSTMGNSGTVDLIHRQIKQAYIVQRDDGSSCHLRTRFRVVNIRSATGSCGRCPSRFRGIHGTADASGSCTLDHPLLLLSASTAVYISESDGRTKVIIGDAFWSDDAGLLARGDDFSILPAIDALDQCSVLPPALQAGYGETFAIFDGIDDLRAQCADGRATSCVEQLFSLLDVSPDRRLSPAEISRGLRAVGMFLAYEAIAARQRSQAGETGSLADAVVPLDTLFGTTFALGVAAPFVTTSLLSSYDFNADGFLSVAEVLQDRENLDIDALSVIIASRFGEDGIRSVLSVLIASMTRMAGGLL